MNRAPITTSWSPGWLGVFVRGPAVACWVMAQAVSVSAHWLAEPSVWGASDPCRHEELLGFYNESPNMVPQTLRTPSSCVRCAGAGRVGLLVHSCGGCVANA
jgi:hypothetical protein